MSKLPKAVPVINIDKIDKILKRDAKLQKLIAGQLICNFNDDDSSCKSIGHCAIGALLADAGYSAKKMEDGRANEVSPISKAGKLLKKEYGLLPAHIDAIESVNDSTFDHAFNYGQQLARYEEVMALISFIDMAQENGIRFQLFSGELENLYEDGESYD